MTKIKSKPLAIFLAGLLFGGFTQAQESANSSGSVATGIGGTAAYSIGQVVYTTNTGSSGSVAQGVQHVYEIISVGIKEPECNISLTAFPNPINDNLTIQITDYKTKSFRISFLICKIN
jgi:hypothetical protein